MKEFFVKFYNKNINNPPRLFGRFTAENAFSNCLDSINEKLGTLGYVNIHLATFTHSKGRRLGTSFYDYEKDTICIGYRYRGENVHFTDVTWYEVRLDKQWRKVEEANKYSQFEYLLDIQLNILKDYLNKVGDVHRLSRTDFWTKPNEYDNLINDLAKKYEYPKDDEFKENYSIKSNIKHDYLIPESKLDENASLLEKLCEKYYLDTYYDETKRYKMKNSYEVFVSILQNLASILREEGYISLFIRTFVINDSRCVFSTFCSSGNYITLRYSHGDDNTISSIDLNVDFSIKKLGYNSDNSKSLRIIIKILNDYVISQNRFNELISGNIEDRSLLLALADKYSLTKEKDYIKFPEATRYNLCSNYIPVKDIWKIENIEKNSILKLKGIKKNSKKIEEYIFLDRDDEGTIAVKSLEDNKILFLQCYDNIEDSYDALFYETKQEVRGWKSRARRVIF